MAINSTDTLVEGLAKGELVPFHKASISAAAGQVYSLWTAGGMPGAGSTPPTGAGEAPDDTEPGAIIMTAPGAGDLPYLASVEAMDAIAGMLLAYDRLVHTSGLDGTVTSAQTVNSTALTRSTDGKNVEAFLEIYTQIGVTSRTATISYTNQDGTSGRTGTCSVGGTTGRDVGRLIPIQLQAGDYGVKSVQSVTLSGSTGTAGNFGVTLARRIAELPIGDSNSGNARGVLEQGLPELSPDACIWVAYLSASTTTGAITGAFNIAKN